MIDAALKYTAAMTMSPNNNAVDTYGIEDELYLHKPRAIESKVTRHLPVHPQVKDDLDISE